MGQAHSLDGLSSKWGKSRVHGPAHLLNNFSAIWERAKISDPVYNNRELRNFYFWSRVWESNGNGKPVAGFENFIR